MWIKGSGYTTLADYLMSPEGNHAEGIERRIARVQEVQANLIGKLHKAGVLSGQDIAEIAGDTFRSQPLELTEEFEEAGRAG